MNDEIVFYHSPMSRGRIVHWMLEELGVPYRLELIDLDKGEQKSARLLKLNPMGKLPTLVHRGVVVTEAAAICAYLADAFPDAKLAPALDDPARGTYLRWLFFAAACVEPALTDKAFPRVQKPSPRAVGYGSYEDVVNTLEAALKPGPYLLGDRFTAADVYVASQIGWSMLVTRVLESRPVFAAYHERCAARPAAQRSDAKNKELLGQHSA